MELYLEPIKFTRNAKNGKFLKGHSPFNKGKKMTDYLTEEKIQLVIVEFVNLRIIKKIESDEYAKT